MARPSFNALLPVVCEPAGRLLGSAVATIFSVFLLQLLARILPKKLHPVVLLLDIISCRPRPRHRLSGHKKCLKVGAEVSSGTVFSAEAWLAIEWSELGMAVAIERTPVILCALLAFTDLVAASSGASLTFAPEAAGFK